MGRTRNINQGGILLETHAPIDPHHFVYLAIHLEDQHIHVKGRIVHQIRRYGGKYESGIQFVEPDEMSLSVLTEFIAAFNRQE